MTGFFALRDLDLALRVKPDLGVKAGLRSARGSSVVDVCSADTGRLTGVTMRADGPDACSESERENWFEPTAYVW
jgi:hypothetical protein